MSRHVRSAAAVAVVLASAAIASAEDVMITKLAYLKGTADTTINRAGCTPDCSNAWAFCGASATMMCWAACIDGCGDAESDTDNATNGTACSASADAVCQLSFGGYFVDWDCPEDRGFYSSYSSADVSISSCGGTINISSEVEAQIYVEKGSCIHSAVTNCGLGVPCTSTCFGRGSDWEVEQEFSSEFEFTFCVDEPNCVPPTPMRGDSTLYRSVTVLDVNLAAAPATAGAWASGPGVKGVGTKYNSKTDEWEGTLSLSGSGNQELVVKPFQIAFYDNDMDVNEDGRFNELDVTALNALIGEDGYDQWDFDADETIDADDVALMQDLVDLEWDSGLFGDVDGDGDVDCDDLDGVDSLYPDPNDPNDIITLLEATYQPELDYDLDGVLDESDRHWMYNAVWEGDVDADGDVDLSDLSDLLARYGDCVGDADYREWVDFNHDGCINLSDQAALLANYNESCP